MTVPIPSISLGSLLNHSVFKFSFLRGKPSREIPPLSLDAPRSMTVTEALPSAAAAAAMPDFVTRVEGTERDHITEEIIAESCDRLCGND